MYRKVIQSFVNIIYVCLLIIFVIYLSSALYYKDFSKASVCGYKIIYVASGSMESTIKTGSLVLCKMKNSNELKVGDICTYVVYINGKRKIIIHRIIDITNDGLYIFKGDNNPIKDFKPIVLDQIRAKVILIL